MNPLYKAYKCRRCENWRAACAFGKTAGGHRSRLCKPCAGAPPVGRGRWKRHHPKAKRGRRVCEKCLVEKDDHLFHKLRRGKRYTCKSCDHDIRRAR